MTEETNRWIDAITRLIRMTQEGTILWKAHPPTEDVKNKPTDRIEIVLTTQYKEKSLRLYKRFYKAFRTHVGFVEAIIRPSGGVEAYWAEQVILEFVDDQGLPLWSFPKLDVLEDLLVTVHYQVADVKQFIDDLLDED